MPHDDVLLAGIRVVSIAINLPGPAAARRFAQLGADVVKVEPPSGDQMQQLSAPYYRELAQGQRIVTLDLKSPQGRAGLDELLAQADLLITSHRPSALARLGLDWDSLHTRFPKLGQVAIVGHPGPDAETAGHDLTYQAVSGTLQPPLMPRVLLADLAAAERAVADGLAIVLAAQRTGEGRFREIALSDVAATMAEPVRHGLTAPDGILGGALPGYAIYAASDGHVALSSLEPHFWKRTQDALQVEGTREELTSIFSSRTADEWEQWAREHDIPLAAVRVQ